MFVNLAKKNNSLKDLEWFIEFIKSKQVTALKVDQAKRELLTLQAQTLLSSLLPASKEGLQEATSIQKKIARNNAFKKLGVLRTIGALLHKYRFSILLLILSAMYWSAKKYGFRKLAHKLTLRFKELLAMVN